MVSLPDFVKATLEQVRNGSYASYALRFVAAFEGVMKVFEPRAASSQSSKRHTERTWWYYMHSMSILR